MEKSSKKLGNKGFSLVELIVVVAIMAVLVSVLAPQYLRYVEKTRLQKDNSAIAEIANAIKLAAADETINSKLGASNTVTLENKTATEDATITFSSVTPAALGTELTSTIGTSYTTSSNTYKKSTVPIELTITKAANGNVTVTAAGWIESVGGIAGTKSFQ